MTIKHLTQFNNEIRLPRSMQCHPQNISVSPPNRPKIDLIDAKPEKQHLKCVIRAVFALDARVVRFW